jgi:hypothetical protein
VAEGLVKVWTELVPVIARLFDFQRVVVSKPTRIIYRRKLRSNLVRFIEKVIDNAMPERIVIYYHFLFRSLIDLAFALASALLDAPQAFSDSNKRVGFPSLYSGPGILPILARNDALRGLSPDFTGGLRSLPGFCRS